MKDYFEFSSPLQFESFNFIRDMNLCVFQEVCEFYAQKM